MLRFTLRSSCFGEEDDDEEEVEKRFLVGGEWVVVVVEGVGGGTGRGWRKMFDLCLPCVMELLIWSCGVLCVLCIGVAVDEASPGDEMYADLSILAVPVVTGMFG